MSRIQKPILLALIVLFAMVASAIGFVSARWRPQPPPHSAVEGERIPNALPSQTAPAVAASQPGTRVPTHQLVLKPTGFEPNEVTWPREPFFLALDNQTRIRDLAIQIDRVQGGRVKAVNLKSKKRRSAAMLDLRPGEYVLREANHPQWECRIRIVAR